MAKNSDHLAGTFETENTGGVLSGLLAEENEFDRASLWRIGSWGAAAVAAVVIAVMANQTSLGMRRDQLAASDLTRQQLQALTRESQNEARRLASAIDTLNSDRDRLYSRVTVLEQGLDSVTGAIARQNSATSPAPAAKPAATTEAPPLAQAQAAAPSVAAVTTTVGPVTTTVTPATTTVLAKSDPVPKSDKPRSEAAAKEQSPAIASPAPPAAPAASTVPAATPPTPSTPLIAAKSILAPPDPGAQKLIEPEKPVVAKAEDPPPPDAAASTAPAQLEPSDAASPKAAVQRTEFAVDVGSANSVSGLRALWRGLSKSNPELAGLHPIIMVKESATGLGMQLRLAAGPLTDAAAAAKICAALMESQRTCDTTVFDGQRLAMKADDQPPPTIKPAPPQQHRHNYYPKRTKKDDPPPKSESSTLSRWFGRDKP